MTIQRSVRRPALLLAAALGTAACGALDVTNPGPIEDEKLNTPQAAAGLVAGMSHRLSESLNLLVEMAGIVSDEVTFSGSFGSFGGVNGVVQPEDLNSTWRRAQQARWVAESGIERMKRSLGADYDSDPYAARANLLAGIANRFLGENFCQAVIDGGPAQDRTVYFDRAEQYFTEAMRIAALAENADYETAALGGRAEVRAALGRWAEAAADASGVPTEFRYEALYNADNSSQDNEIAVDSYEFFQLTLYGNRWAETFDDPRVPWDTLYADDGSIQISANGETPMFQQQKYADGSASIPLVTGVAMRTVEAEAALRAGDVPTAIGHLNEERAFYELPDLAVPATLDEAWSTMRYERGAVTWLEGRRLWDLSRWYEETGPAHDDFMANRSRCFPVSEEEVQSNPNLP